MGEEMSDVSAGSTGSIRLYTGNATGAQGKHKGWSGEGLELYHRIVELLDEQRKSDRHGVMFESQLKKRWRESGSRKWQRGDNGEEDNVTRRVPNHLRLFMESKGIV